MSITLGPVLLTAAETPEKIPLGGELDATDIKLSDGTRLLKITGYTPDDFTLSGTMTGQDGGGDPLGRFERLEALARAHQPVTYTWRGAGRSLSFPVIIRSCRGNVVRRDWVEYTLVLFRQSHSGLVASGYAASTTRNQRLAQHQAGLNSVRNDVGAATATAIDAANQAAAQRRYAR